MDQKMIDILVQAFAVAMGLLVPALVGIVIQLIRTQLGLARIQQIRDELSVKQELVTKGIIFAEQAYKDADGPTKFKYVLDWVVSQLAIFRIKTTVPEVSVFIDSLVKEVKDKWAATDKPVE